jgi:hypothetical protein
MKLTKSKLKQLIKEEIKAVREGYFGRKISDDSVNIFDPSTYKGMFDSEVLDTFEDSLREFISAYLDEKDQMTLGNNKIKKLKTAVMTALEGAEEADPDARIIVKTALEDVEAANRTGDLR